jgi:hypothetical protein
LVQSGNVRAQTGAANAEGRELLRPCDLHLCLLLKRRDPQIVIVNERLTNQVLQLRLAKDLGPLLIAQGTRASLMTAASSAPRKASTQHSFTNHHKTADRAVNYANDMLLLQRSYRLVARSPLRSDCVSP